MSLQTAGYRFGPDMHRVRHLVKTWTYRRKSDGRRIHVTRYRITRELVYPNDLVTPEKLHNLI